MIKRLTKGCAIVLALSSIQSVPARAADSDSPATKLAARILQQCPGGAQLHVITTDEEVSIARPGPRNTGLNVDTSFRVASNTKTFVAATIVSLSQKGNFALDDPIADLLSPRLVQLLREGGYEPEEITVWQVLTHRSGIYGHASDPQFFELFKTKPERRWQRAALVRKAVEWGQPVGSPGERFSYSDTGYLLLGDIIENTTGMTLAAAVRQTLNFKENGMRASWWERFEPAPAVSAARSPQLIEGTDFSQIHASMDLFGGGGLVMPMRDLARGFRAIANGKVFASPTGLQQLLRPAKAAPDVDYRAGVFVDPNGIVWHSGFWGTIAAYQPATDMAISAAVVDRSHFGCVRNAIFDNLKSQSQ